jgi:polyhydroxyalkanoate synthase subunit PhaC
MSAPFNSAPHEKNSTVGNAASTLLGQTYEALAGLKTAMPCMAQLQEAYVEEASALWNKTLRQGAKGPAFEDRRFAASNWSEDDTSAYTVQLYQLNARTLLQMAALFPGTEKTKNRLRFAVQQWVDATAPSNFLALNPEALQRALSTEGASLGFGLGNLWNDLQQGHLSQTNERAFEVGRNVATTEGSVVFENPLFQLIEYKPLTAKVYARPILLVPPCINKFYVLDLQPENSLIRYTVAQGHRVFVVSWRNPDESLKTLTWDDYVEDAVIRAICVVSEISGSAQINTLGFCIGGTLLSTALAVLAARGQKPVASVTLLTTFLDFQDTGVLDLFIDEAMVKARELTLGPQSRDGGRLLRGQELTTTFSFLRPNELVWNYVVGNYLKGEAPRPFDLLYWNNDNTNLSGPMYCWYLRNTYLENNLVKPGHLKVCGQALDLSRIDAPAYVYASREDHIVPWQGAYRSTQCLSGPTRFVLGGSGHIAGVINPPALGKRCHWVRDARSALPEQANDWFEQAQEQPGSWWGDWTAWLQAHAGKQLAAPRRPGSPHYPVIEPAPGRYVKEKAA